MKNIKRGSIKELKKLSRLKENAEIRSRLYECGLNIL
jgi:hypothetical protein